MMRGMGRFRRPAAVAAGVVLGMTVLAAPAAGKGGEIGDGTDRFELTNGWTGRTDLAFVYGRAGDQVYVGDWDGNATDTLAVRRGATYHFRNSLSGGPADRVVTYGRAGDTVLMGDWDGDGVDTPAVRRGNEYHVKNSLRGGEADEVIRYGRAGDEVLVGDWDGDGRDTLEVRRGTTFHIKNTIAGGDADVTLTYGRAGDEVVVGDWDGRGGDTLGVRRGNTFHVKNTIAGGDADIVMAYGAGYFPALAGDWDGDGADSIGLRIAMPPADSTPVTTMDEYDRRLLELINAERISRGLAPAQEWPRLRPAALAQSHRMVGLGRIEHATWDTITAEARAAGCAPASELLVRTWQRNGQAPDPRAALDWYLNSPEHGPYILHPEYRYVASGSVQAGSYVYNTLRWSRGCS